MAEIGPSGKSLGCRIEGMDLTKPLDQASFELVLQALGRHGVVCFPRQSIDATQQKAFASRFGSLEINVAAGPYTVQGHPEVMVL